MIVYKVVVKQNDGTTPGAFVGLDLGETGYTEHANWNQDETESWVIYSERDIDSYLDAAPGVVRYTSRDN